MPACWNNVSANINANSSSDLRIEEINAVFNRILASEEFKASDRIRHFLIYIVMEATAGRTNQIKAYSIAVNVFGRPTNFDHVNDPIVRVEAGRLRQAIERYYVAAGRSDPIIIEIPKSGYVPRFSRRPVPLPSPRPSKKLRLIRFGPGLVLRKLSWALVGLSVLIAIVGIARFWVLT